MLTKTLFLARNGGFIFIGNKTVKHISHSSTLLVYGYDQNSSQCVSLV